MIQRHAIPFAGLLGLIAAAGAGGTVSCGETHLAVLCASDAQCIEEHDGNPNWQCHDRGQCVCINDDACGENEHCSVLPAGDGTCRPDQLCEFNSECPNGETCTPFGKCAATCETDLQCPIGKVCDPISRYCVEGCWSHGDCAGRGACYCDAGNELVAPCECEDPSKGCQLGVCRDDACGDHSFCKYGELCVPDERGVGHCAKDERGRYCATCVLTPGETTYCGATGPDFCLVDPYDPARLANFCGVDCDENQECPNGFACVDVLRPPSGTCFSSADCRPPPNALECEEDEDCPGGSRCSNGQCAGLCFGHEGGSRGFCSCTTHEECPQDRCVGGRCDITRRRCTNDFGVDTCADNILCVNDGDVGYCRIGANCAPASGLSCDDIRSGTGEPD